MSGIYTEYIIPPVGCGHTDTLHLTINSSNGSTDTQEHCDSYIWLDNVEYTESNNTATKTYTNTSGCDSIVTLDLTINNSNGSTDIQEHCDSYMWLDSNIYTVSNNTATMTYTNVLGCDSVVTLDLTINTVIASIDQDGDSLFPNTKPIQISETANWYNTQTTTEDTITTTKIWLMEEGSATFKPRFDCSYFIVVADENGCVDTSDVYNFGSSASRIVSLITSPNPSNGMVSVQFENSKNQFVKLELMNGQGAKLDEFVSTDSEMNIDLSKYPSGTYYLYFDSRHTVKGCFDEQKEMIMNKIILNK